MRNKRDLTRIDYKKFHETGERVIKDMTDSNSSKEKLSEAKIVADINEFYDLFNLSDLSSEEEIRDGLDVAFKNSKLYRDIHTELKSGLGKDYDRVPRL